MCACEKVCMCLNMYILAHLFIAAWLMTPVAPCEVSHVCRGKAPSAHCIDLVFTIPYQLYALLTSTGILGEGTAGRDEGQCRKCSSFCRQVVCVWLLSFIVFAFKAWLLFLGELSVHKNSFLAYFNLRVSDKEHCQVPSGPCHAIRQSPNRPMIMSKYPRCCYVQIKTMVHFILARWFAQSRFVYMKPRFGDVMRHEVNPVLIPANSWIDYVYFMCCMEFINN